MKKRWLCALAALALAAVPARAAGGLIGALTAETPAPSAEATPAAAGRVSVGGISLALPAGMEVLEGEALEGFEAAVRFDYPGAAETVLAARDAARGAALAVAVADTDADCLDAARRAAEALAGDPGAATEARFGENRCARFSCAVGEQTYELFYLSDGERLLLVGASGLDGAALEALLSGLRF